MFQFSIIKRFSIRPLMISMLVLGVISLTACSAKTTQSKADSDSTDAVTAALRKIANRSDHIYSLASNTNWERAGVQLDEVKKAAQSFKSNAKGVDTTTLDKQVATLEQSVGAKNSLATKQAANQLVLTSTSLVKQTHTALPADLMVLTYYAHNLQMAADAKDTATLQTTSKTISQTWSTARSQIAAKAKPDQVQQMDAIVKQVENAKSTADYTKSAQSLVKTEKSIEKSLDSKDNQ